MGEGDDDEEAVVAVASDAREDEEGLVVKGVEDGDGTAGLLEPLLAGSTPSPSPSSSYSSSSWALFLSAVATLSLFLVGCSILPLPWAFARCGLVLGALISLAVAGANYYTSRLLVRHASPDAASYEELSLKAGGPALRLVAQVSLVLLLFGTICGDLAVIASVSYSAASQALPSAPSRLRAWVVGPPEHETSLRLLLFATAAILLPLSLPRRVDSLRHVGAAAMGVLFVIMGQVVVDSLRAGLPEFAWTRDVLWRVDARTPQAIGVLGFAFYLQPGLPPISRELPPGKQGKRVLISALTVTYAVGTLVYISVGAFGFLRFGQKTGGNILAMYSGRWAVALDVASALYVSTAFPPIVHALRYTLDELIAGPNPTFSLLRHLMTTIVPVVGGLFIAISVPNVEDLFAFTGATAVCFVCYILPVVIHLRLEREDDTHLHGVALQVLDKGFAWLVMIAGCIVSLGSLWSLL
eukprot:jgi/Chlat1/1700/Chrsp127S01961